MGDPRGFLTVPRVDPDERRVRERIHDWHEIQIPPSGDRIKSQASRCMDCGIPFCHHGCPLGNLIPEFNDLVWRGDMKEAARRLLATNDFPEITGRICPAPCEASCVLGMRKDEAVTIKAIEHAIADTMTFEPVKTPRSGKSVGVVGSGPAGLAAAKMLSRFGHRVVVYEKDDRLGGLLRYGIPDFKLEKDILDRRIAQMREEGVHFETNVEADASFKSRHDALLLAMGARTPRDLSVPGRDLDGVHFAMEFLEQQNRRVAGESISGIDANGKRVIVLGGGDTGADCVGTSIRQGAASVLQLELMPKPPLVRAPQNPWPEWPFVLRTSTSHEEGADRDWAVQTRAFRGENGRVAGLEAVRVVREEGRIRAIPGTEFTIPCDLVLLAMGFTGPNIATDAAGATKDEGIFAAGDVSRGQSLVVWALADGRRAASGIDAWLRRNTKR